MADRKKHHYVPRFYMKRFGSTDKSIHLINTKSLRPVQNASIADQCQQTNLYNSGLEDGLSKLESLIAREVYHTGDYSRVTSDMWHLFAATQYLRVPRENDPGKTFTGAVADRWIKWQLENNPELRDRDTSYKLTGNSIEMLLGVLPSILDSMHGLKAQVAKIDTPRFILGDKPVVLYNQYCEQVEHYSGLGFTRSGIQLFMPISPKEYLLLYDGQVYDYVKSQSVTYGDIETLNALQILQSESNLYFSSWAEQELLTSHIQKVGQSLGYGWPLSHHCSVCPEDFIHIQTLMPDIRLNLSFLRVKKRATRLPIRKRSIPRLEMY